MTILDKIEIGAYYTIIENGMNDMILVQSKDDLNGTVTGITAVKGNRSVKVDRTIFIRVYEVQPKKYKTFKTFKQVEDAPMTLQIAFKYDLQLINKFKENFTIALNKGFTNPQARMYAWIEHKKP